MYRSFILCKTPLYELFGLKLFSGKTETFVKFCNLLLDIKAPFFNHDSANFNQNFVKSWLAINWFNRQCHRFCHCIFQIWAQFDKGCMKSHPITSPSSTIKKSICAMSTLVNTTFVPWLKEFDFSQSTADTGKYTITGVYKPF